MRTALLILALWPRVAFSQTPESLSIQERARVLLDHSLKDKNPDTRAHAVQALGLVSPSEPYLSQLEAMLQDKDVPVRLAAITSLVDLKNQAYGPSTLAQGARQRGARSELCGSQSALGAR